MEDIEPEPPPLPRRTGPPPIPQQPPEPPAFISSPPQRTGYDLSSTDGRTVASLACAALGLMTCMACYFAGPMPPAVGIVLAIFAKPSPLRTAAIVANAGVLFISLLWIFIAALYMVSEL